MSAASIKIIYVARRNPALSREAFPRRWRRHGALAMSLGLWPESSGYLHCDVAADPPRAADTETPSAWTGEFDGVGIIFFDDASAFARLNAHPDAPQMIMDAWGAFTEPVGRHAVLAREERFRDGPGTAVKLFAFLPPAAGVSAEEFHERWQQHATRIMHSSELPELMTAYTHNRALTTEELDEAAPGLGDRMAASSLSAVQGVAELGFASRADLEAYLSHPGRAGVRSDLERFADLGGAVLVQTNEVIMDPIRRPAVPAARSGDPC